MANLLRANLEFYKDKPSSRIIYRVTYDQMVVDNKLSESVRDALESVFFILGGLVIMNYVYQGIFLVISAVIFYIIYKLMVHFFKVQIAIV
jgi:ABC-type multidrug transport system fused ATPase/permease subunit